MKKTKSMYYKPSYNADDLYIYIVNDRQLYNNALDIIKNLKKHYSAGLYDKERAISLWYALATTGAKKYSKEYPENRFNVTDRYTAAVDLEARYYEYVED